ncbi:MAG TPA: hypothetical protein DDZ80_03030 [Cyanobacteria bacterium UBA8803]|nr:hypothetical protein [Cyanobacteria bacterium UBA9273]HBL57552.1 hypothetical protein [Cyanobacteria bacterium UBA8803]
MLERSQWTDRLVLDKGQVFQQNHALRGQVMSDRTIINLNALQRNYKLGQAYANIRNLEFRTNQRLDIQSFKDYISIWGDLIKLGLDAEEKPRPSFPVDESYRNQKTALHYPKGDLLVLVAEAVYSAVAASLNQYVLDVGRDGYWATVHVVKGGTPNQVRAYIKKFQPVGVLMVGAIAVPWYQIDGDQFPCDLYYMDTNGTWQDADANGLFDGHSGDLNPEIWVGRIYTPTANGNDANLINNYFARNHKFRLGMLGHGRSALAYVDDDWTGFDDCGFDELFPASSITKYTNPATTDADLYKAEVNSMRSWVQLCAHSWPQGHALRVGDTNEYIQVPYFRDTNPPNAHFYNLFCCGPGKFTEDNYLAGWYIFDQSGGGTNLGLGAIASAKSGSMLFFEDFYRPMGQGKVIGDAFVDWWKARGPEHEDWERYWFYGLVLLGDPTLTWWKGAVPKPEQPQPGDVFDHWPRKMQFRWDPVNLDNVKYTLEVDAYGAVNGKWSEETNQSFLVYHDISGITLNHTFVGAQRGRWRVRANVDGTACSWSPWSYFQFTI